VHVRYCCFGGGSAAEKDVGCTAVVVKSAINGHVDVLDCAVCAEDLTQMSFVHVLCELLHDNLCASRRRRAALAPAPTKAPTPIPASTPTPGSAMIAITT